MQEEITVFNQYVPKNINTLSDACNRDIKECSRDIILKHRQIVLLNLFRDEIYPPYFPTDKKEFYSFIDQHATKEEMEAFPEQRKTLIKNLYEHFINNLQDLVTVSLAASHIFDPNSFAFFNYSTLPSIFGYFSSYEHIAFGYRFYCQLLQKAPHHLFFEMLHPFFENATTYRFIETLSEQIIEFFCQDLRILKQDHMQQILDEDTNILHRTIIKYLSLLPKPHLNLFILMRNNKFSTQDIYKFIVTDFIKPCVSEYLKASPYSGHIKLFQQLCDRLAITSDKRVIDELFRAHALADVPSMFADFEQTSMEIAATPLDSSLLSTLVHSTGSLSKLCEMVGQQSQLETQSYAPIWIRVFPKLTLHPVAAIGGHFIFTKKRIEVEHVNIPRFEHLRHAVFALVGDPLEKLDAEAKCLKDDSDCDLSQLCDSCRRAALEGKSERCEICKLKQPTKMTFGEYVLEQSYDEAADKADNLEKILEKRCCLNVLKTWGDVVSAHLNVLLSAHGERLIDEFFSEHDDEEVRNFHIKPATFLADISPMLNTEKNRLLFFTARAEYLMDSVVTEYVRKELASIEERWGEVMDAAEPIQLPAVFRTSHLSLRTIINKRFVSIAASINTVTVQPFTKRFFHILECLRDLDELSKYLGIDSLIPNALRICHSPGVISSFLKCIALLMKKNEFVSMLPKDDAELWYGLESELLKLLRNDETSLLIYTRLIDRLIVSI